MPLYEFITQARKGAPYRRASVEASSVLELNARLSSQNRPVVQVIEPAATKRKGRMARVRLRSRLLFLQQLEACAYLGVDLRTSLGMCLASTSKRSRGDRQLLGVLKELRNLVSRGASFSRAAKGFPEI